MKSQTRTLFCQSERRQETEQMQGCKHPQLLCISQKNGKQLSIKTTVICCFSPGDGQNPSQEDSQACQV